MPGATAAPGAATAMPGATTAPSRQQSKTNGGGNGTNAGTVDPLFSGGSGLGNTVSKYESGSGNLVKQLGTIGDIEAGNPSYGKYQIETKHGTMNEFLSYLDKTNPEMSATLKNNPINSPEFMKTWKDLAENDTNTFFEAQKGYIKNKKYNPAIAHAHKLGFKTNDPKIQEAVWSASIQHGGVKKVLNEAVAKNPNFDKLSADEQIKILYDARGDYAYRNIKGSEKYRQAASYERYAKEVVDVLNMKEPDKEPDQFIVNNTEETPTNVTAEQSIPTNVTAEQSIPTIVDTKQSTPTIEPENNQSLLPEAPTIVDTKQSTPISADRYSTAFESAKDWVIPPEPKEIPEIIAEEQQQQPEPPKKHLTQNTGQQTTPTDHTNNNNIASPFDKELFTHLLNRVAEIYG
jgi:hypothetical protein